MATYYIRGQTGSDSADGLTAATAKKTFDGLVAAYTVASGDTIYVAEEVHSNATFTGAATGGPALLGLTSLSNVSVLQEPGGTQADIRGDWKLVQTGWTASTNAWQLTLTGAAAAQPVAVGYNFDANIDANGRRYGHLIPDSLANVQGATGSKGRWNYNTATKVLTVYLGGDNPNSSGKVVNVCFVPASQAGLITITGGSGNTVQGLNFTFCPAPAASGQVGWGVIFTSSPNSTGVNLVGRDLGAHAFGAYASGSSASGCTFTNCESWSGRNGGGGAFIHYTTSAFTLTGQRINCRVYAYRYLGLDGLTRDDGTVAQDAFTGFAFYAHADSGSPITDLLDDGCTVAYLENPGFAWVAYYAANITAAGDASVWSSHAYRVDRSQIVYGCMETMSNANNYAYRRCTFQQTRQLSDGSGGTRGAWTLWTGAGAGSILFEACEFILDLDDASAGAGGPVRAFTVNATSNDSVMRFVNCSMHDTSTQTASDFRAFFDYIGANANLFRVNGCSISYLTSGSTRALCIADSGTSAANHGFSDNAYWQINDSSSRWSQNSSFDTAAEWIANVDTAGRVLSTAAFPNAPTALSLTSASSLWPLRRTTSTVVPAAGINGPYTTFYGAYQYSAGRPPVQPGDGGGTTAMMGRVQRTVREVRVDRT